jgi:hypothetical protein
MNIALKSGCFIAFWLKIFSPIFLYLKNIRLKRFLQHYVISKFGAPNKDFHAIVCFFYSCVLLEAHAYNIEV